MLGCCCNNYTGANKSICTVACAAAEGFFPLGFRLRTPCKLRRIFRSFDDASLFALEPNVVNECLLARSLQDFGAMFVTISWLLAGNSGMTETQCSCRLLCSLAVLIEQHVS